MSDPFRIFDPRSVVGIDSHGMRGMTEDEMREWWAKMAPAMRPAPLSIMYDGAQNALRVWPEQKEEVVVAYVPKRRWWQFWRR